jgi:hypothetical protein
MRPTQNAKGTPRRRAATAARRRASRRRVVSATRRRTHLPCITFIFLSPLLCLAISTLAPPTICGGACASIRPTSMLIWQSTVPGSSKPTWHSSRKRLPFASRLISSPARVGRFVSVTSTSGIRHHSLSLGCTGRRLYTSKIGLALLSGS